MGGFVYLKSIIFVGLLVALSSCGDNGDRIKQNAQIQSEESAKKTVEAENSNLEMKAKEKEADLARRQRFMDAVVGTYEGTSTVGKDSFLTRVIFTSSLPAYVPPNRVRSLAEIENDLNSLYLNVVENLWDYDHTILGGCVFEKIKPNLQTGEINLVSEGCKKAYYLKIVDAPSSDPAPPPSNSKSLPSRILDGTVIKVQRIEGIAQSIFSAEPFNVALTRKN